MFKKLVVPALALAAASVAIPAAAQSYGPSYGNGYGHGPRQPGPPAYQNAGYGNWQSINQRQANLDRRIDQGVRNGSLSGREARGLRGQFFALVRLEANYRRGGLNNWERADLDRRFDSLSASIRSDRHDGDGRYGNDGRYGHDGRRG